MTLNYGCKRVDPKLNLDQLDNNLSNDLRNNLEHTSLTSRANKIYDVKITNYNTNVEGGLTYRIPGERFYSGIRNDR
jgi:hypothetical protein